MANLSLVRSLLKKRRRAIFCLPTMLAGLMLFLSPHPTQLEAATFKVLTRLEAIAQGRINHPTPLAEPAQSSITSPTKPFTSRLRFGLETINTLTEIQFKAEKLSTGGFALRFDEAHLTVNDLFYGALDLRFFTWRLEAGESPLYNDTILRPGKFQGVYASLRPYDLTQLEFGYGIAQASERYTPTSASNTSSAISRSYGQHAFKSALKIQIPFLPFAVYSAAVLRDQSANLYDSAAPKPTFIKEQALDYTALGFEIDLLNWLIPKAAQLSFSYVFAEGSKTFNPYTEQNEATITTTLAGVIPLFKAGRHSLALAHAFFFATDQATKSGVRFEELYATGGVLRDEEKGVIKDYLSLKLKPSYTLTTKAAGTFTFALPVSFGYIGKNNSAYSQAVSMDSVFKELGFAGWGYAIFFQDFISSGPITTALREKPQGLMNPTRRATAKDYWLSNGGKGYLRYSAGLEAKWSPVENLTVTSFFIFTKKELPSHQVQLGAFPNAAEFERELAVITADLSKAEALGREFIARTEEQFFSRIEVAEWQRVEYLVGLEVAFALALTQER